MYCIGLLSLLFTALTANSARAENHVDYNGHQALRIKTNGDVDGILSTLSSVQYNQWNLRLDDHIDLSLSGSELKKLENLGLDYTILHADLGASIAKEMAYNPYTSPSTSLSKRQASNYTSPPSRDLPDDSWFDSYHSYDDHRRFWRDLNAAFPQNSEWFEIGLSREDRPIWGLKLWGKKTDVPKRAVIWHGTVHAREWIVATTIEYVVKNLIEGYREGDRIFTGILDQFDFYVLPFVNPDGLVHSQTVDRLWRKDRTPTQVNATTICFGIDLNRAWPYVWNQTGGASNDPCSQTYRGARPGQAPETRALIAHMMGVTVSQPLAQYIDFHSYGNLILSPYGHTNTTVPGNSDAQVAVGERAKAAIMAVHGTNYTVGPARPTLYWMSGSGVDFAYEVAGAEYAYLMELRDDGTNAFVLPPEEIRPTAEEVLEGVKVMLNI